MVTINGKDITSAVVDVQLLADISAAMQEFERVCGIAANRIALFGEVYFRMPMSGPRRHGLIKHFRDVARQEAKQEARRV